MSNENLPDEELSREENEARDDAEEVVIDPNGPPKPVDAEEKRKPSTLVDLAFVLGVSVAGAGIFLMLGGGGVMGATRSSRLEMERREAEIDRAVAEAEARKTAASSGEETKGRAQ